MQTQRVQALALQARQYIHMTFENGLDSDQTRSSDVLPPLVEVEDRFPLEIPFELECYL